MDVPVASGRRGGRPEAGKWRTAGILVLICGLHAAVLAEFWSPSWLGFPHDDTLYLAAGKSVAGGEGAVFPSLPGEPRQTKYPPLYPLLLSLLWRGSGDLNGILAAGYWLNLSCGSAFLAGCYVLMRQLGLGRLPALGLTAMIAVHPPVVGLNLLLLSDPPFMAWNVWALVTAHWAFGASGGAAGAGVARWAVVAALLSAAALTRSAGIATIAGVGACGLLRRKQTGAILAAAAGAAVFGAQFWWAQELAVSPDAGGDTGLRQVMLFYTSYGEFWKLCIPDWRTLAAVVLFNFREVLKEPAMECFLLPVGGFDGGLLQMAGVAVSVGVVKGVVGLGSARGWHPAHAALLALLPLVIVWNYPLANRFLLPFLPLFLAGAWREFTLLAGSGTKVVRGNAAFADRAVCLVFGAALAALPAYAAYQAAWRSPRTLGRVVAHRETMAAESREAMGWIRAHTSRDDRFISYQGARLYLETGRKAIRPMAFRTSALYLQDETILKQDLAGMADVARGISARYWIRAEDDFHLEVGERQILKAVDELLAGVPLVFESSGSRVRIYDVSALR